MTERRASPSKHVTVPMSNSTSLSTINAPKSALTVIDQHIANREVINWYKRLATLFFPSELSSLSMFYKEGTISWSSASCAISGLDKKTPMLLVPGLEPAYYPHA
jgi:hypothetical protein